MKEKFRLWCDLNAIDDIQDMDSVADSLANAKHLHVQHRYSYLLRGFHDLTHGIIDDEVFFTLGDITSTKNIFTDTSGLESVFAIEENNSDETLYIVEKSSRSYYVGKVSDKGQSIRDTLHGRGSAILVV